MPSSGRNGPISRHGGNATIVLPLLHAEVVMKGAIGKIDFHAIASLCD